MEHLTGFETLAARYDGFILDLWGVIHDGVAPYPGAIAALERLRAHGKRVVFLSNAPRRAAVARAHLHDMGVSDDLYDGIVTSGEQAWRWLADRDDPWFARLGGRAFYLGTERDRSVLDGLGLTLADAPEDADFVVNTGPDDLDDPTEVGPFEAVLAACRAAGLPMLCANPDLHIVRDGLHMICAGALAERYETLGGDVRWVGKPDAAIYPPTLALLGLQTARVLAAGDALRTDIAGAAAAGLDSCWILDGIHGNEFDRTSAAIERAASEAGLSPNASLPRFVW